VAMLRVLPVLTPLTATLGSAAAASTTPGG
jgi:hypothetical protein